VPENHVEIHIAAPRPKTRAVNIRKTIEKGVLDPYLYCAEERRKAVLSDGRVPHFAVSFYIKSYICNL